VLDVTLVSIPAIALVFEVILAVFDAMSLVFVVILEVLALTLFVNTNSAA
jgi:hypothetical protein